MSDALKRSEDFQIEQAMLDDKLKATDWEATNEEIMELVAQESYLQWLKDNEKRSSHPTTSSSAAAAATCSSWGDSSSSSPPRRSKQSPAPLLGAMATAATTSADLDDDSDILAQVLAASQQDYLDSLKAKRHQQHRSS